MPFILNNHKNGKSNDMQLASHQEYTHTDPWDSYDV